MKEITPILDSEKFNTILSALKHNKRASKKLSTEDWFLKNDILGATLWHTALNNDYISPLDLPEDVVMSKFKSNRIEGDVITALSILNKLVSEDNKDLAVKFVHKYPKVLTVRDKNVSFFTIFVDNFGISKIKDLLSGDILDTVIDNYGTTIAEWVAKNLPTLAISLLPKEIYKDIILKYNPLLQNSEKLLNMV